MIQLVQMAQFDSQKGRIVTPYPIFCDLCDHTMTRVVHVHQTRHFMHEVESPLADKVFSCTWFLCEYSAPSFTMYYLHARSTLRISAVL